MTNGQVVALVDIPEGRDVVTTHLRRYADTVHVEYSRSLTALDESIDAYFAIGRALLEARRVLLSDQAFGLWFSAQNFGFSRRWAHVLRTAAEYEPDVRAAVGTQVPTGAPNIKKAVQQVRAALAQKAAETVIDTTATVIPIASRHSATERIEDIRRLTALGLPNTEIADILGIGTARVNVLASSVGIAVAKRSRAAIAERVEQTRLLAKQGATSQQIADELGVRVELVRGYSRKYGIEIPADATTVSTRHIDSTRIVSRTIDTIDGIGVMFDHIDYAALPVDEIASWITALDTSIRSLTTLRKHLKEMIQP